jgi:hypothetical protein
MRKGSYGAGGWLRTQAVTVAGDSSGTVFGTQHDRTETDRVFKDDTEVKAMRRGTPLAGLVLITVIAGCGAKTKANSEPKRFATPDGLVELQFPDGWSRSKDENPYDLQCVSKDERMVTNVFQFKREDLAKDIDPHDLLQAQIADLQSKREGFVLVEPESRTQDADKTITTVVYAGEKAASRYYYRFTLLESSAPASVFAVVIQTSLPSEWETNKHILGGITRSGRIRAAGARSVP